ETTARWVAPVDAAIAPWGASASETVASATAFVSAPLAAAAHDGILREVGAAMLGGTYVAGLMWLSRAAAVSDALRLPTRSWDGASMRRVPSDRSGGGLAPIGPGGVDHL